MKKLVSLAILVLIMVPVYAVAARSATDSGPKPSIVLIHGAWADGSGWSGVIQRLQEDGYTVYAPPNPLRNLTTDAAYIASFLQSISGPIILVGHSYGGAVITNAATGNPNVKALVYIDGFAPDQGEAVLQLLAMPPPPGQSATCLGPDPTQVFNFVPYPGAPTGDFDAYLKPNIFPSCFANELSLDKAAVLASSQRPLTLSAGLVPSGVPAWKTIPSWYLIGTLDHVIPPYLQLFMAQRAHSTIVQITAMHPAMISHPKAVTDLIEEAANSVTGTSNTNQGLTLATTSL